MSKKVIYGEDLWDFIQISDGSWVGMNWNVVAVTAPYPIGQSPTRFKYEPFQRATKAQQKEYWEKKRISE